MNLTYELAEELKDAGFPQEGNGEYVEDVGNYDEMGMTVVTYAPTLTELIAACGEKLRYLQRVENGGWVAGTYDSHESGVGLPDSNVWKGDTPEEAVARLYLALNKKP